MYHVTPHSNINSIQREGLCSSKASVFDTRSGVQQQGQIFLAEDKSVAIDIAIYAVWTKVVPPQKFALLEVNVPAYMVLYPDLELYGSAFIVVGNITPDSIKLIKVFDLSRISPLPLESTDARYTRKDEGKRVGGPAGSTSEEEAILERELQTSGLDSEEIQSAIWSATSG